MIDLKTVNLWSEAEQAVVSWDLKPITETIDDVEVVTVLEATHGDELLRFSPNTTEEEFKKYADPSEKGHTV